MSAPIQSDIKRLRESVRRAQTKARKATKVAEAMSATNNGAARICTHPKSKPAIAPTIGEQE